MSKLKKKIIGIVDAIAHLNYALGIKKRKGTLVYLGMHKGEGFSKIFYKYEVCYGFEANPELYADLLNSYNKWWCPEVKLYNLAVADKDCELTFNISSNGGASSSIGTFDENWTNKTVKMVRQITVPAINLLNFLKKEKIEVVEEYVSDIQGFDLTVLKTLEPLIKQGGIKRITCETTKDGYRNIYKDLPDNSFKAYEAYLGDYYNCVAKGWGAIKEGDFKEVPADWWEFDCMWKLK